MVIKQYVEINGKLEELLIRPYTQNDFEQLIDIQRECFPQVADDGYIRNHNPQGNTLYVVDISVRPSYRSLGIGKLLKNMQTRYCTGK